MKPPDKPPLDELAMQFCIQFPKKGWSTIFKAMHENYSSSEITQAVSRASKVLKMVAIENSGATPK